MGLRTLASPSFAPIKEVYLRIALVFVPMVENRAMELLSDNCNILGIFFIHLVNVLEILAPCYTFSYASITTQLIMKQLSWVHFVIRQVGCHELRGRYAAHVSKVLMKIAPFRFSWLIAHDRVDAHLETMCTEDGVYRKIHPCERTRNRLSAALVGVCVLVVTEEA